MEKISTSITNGFCPQTLFLYGTRKEDGSPKNFELEVDKTIRLEENSVVYTIFD